MDYQGLMRRKLLEQIYEKMSDEEKRTFIQMTMQNKDHNEIIEALKSQQQQIGRVADKVESQTWLSSFGSDIAANFTSDGIIYLLSRILRSLK